MASRTYLSPNADVMTLAIRQRVWRKFLQVKKLSEAREGMQSSRCKQALPPPPPPPLWGLEETAVLSSSVEKGCPSHWEETPAGCHATLSPLLALAH